MESLILAHRGFQSEKSRWGWEEAGEASHRNTWGKGRVREKRAFLANGSKVLFS